MGNGEDLKGCAGAWQSGARDWIGLGAQWLREAMRGLGRDKQGEGFDGTSVDLFRNGLATLGTIH